jgi:hypothetical protein
MSLERPHRLCAPALLILYGIGRKNEAPLARSAAAHQTDQYRR